jgi:hypothetical protein
MINIYKENKLSEEDTVSKIGNSDFSTKPLEQICKNKGVIWLEDYQMKNGLKLKQDIS